MNRITLQELIDALSSLPESVKSKSIGYLDLAHVDDGDLLELCQRLKDSPNEWIEECSG